MQPTNTFTLQRGAIQLQAYQWVANEPKAHVLLIHGYGEHANRYQHVAAHFSQHNLNLFAVDLTGHGQSSGKRGDIQSYDDYLDDVERLLDRVAKQNEADLPIMIYGHSMGGGIVLSYLLKRDTSKIKAAIATSSWIRLTAKVPKLRLAMGKLLLRLGINVTEKANLDVANLSRDPEVGKAYTNDPLVHASITARAFTNIVDNGEWLLENAQNLSTPTLIAHGNNDDVTDFEASKLFAERAGEIATFKVWPDCRHETQNELNKEEVIAFYEQWLGKWY